MKIRFVLAAVAALGLSVPTAGIAQEKIDYTRWEQLVEACPTVMSAYASRKDELALHYNAKSDKQFVGVLHDCQAKEAEAKYPRPPHTPRDIANYKKIAEAAAKHKSAMKKVDESAVKGMKVSTDMKTRAKYRVPASSCGPKDAGQRILVEVGGGVIARVRCP